MRIKSFAKAMLYAMCRIPDLLDEIDDCARVYAKNSSNINYDILLSAYDYAERIIACTERKKKLITLYRKLKYAFSCCSEKHRKLLSAKYFDGKNCKQLCKTFALCERSMFRYVHNALVQFAKRLMGEGVTNSDYLKSLKSETWLLNAMYRIDKSARGRKTS